MNTDSEILEDYSDLESVLDELLAQHDGAEPELDDEELDEIEIELDEETDDDEQC
jgi:hypothetical protein